METKVKLTVLVAFLGGMLLLHLQGFSQPAMGQKTHKLPAMENMAQPSDAISPTQIILNCSNDVWAQAQAGQCSTVAYYDLPLYMGGQLYVTGPPSGSVFEVGVTTITFIVVNTLGASKSCSISITVVDNEPPVVELLEPITLPTDPGSNLVAGLVLTPPAASDNCSQVVVSGDAPDSFVFGTTLVTWMAEDASLNTAVTTQPIDIVDLEPPTLMCPEDMIVVSVTPCQGTPVFLETPLSFDNTGSAIVTSDAPDLFPFGTTMVSWTSTDQSGNIASCIQSVTIINNQPPSMTCPADIISCTGPGNNGKNIFSIDPIIEEQCPYTLTYSLSGATEGSGNCTEQGGISGSFFNTGVTSVFYTVQNILTGESSGCSFLVTINTSQPAGILVNQADDFCSGLSLTAFPSTEGLSFQWSNGMTSPGIFLSLTDPAATYSVTISDGQGCISPATVTYTYAPGDLVSSYTIIGFEELQFNDYNEVQTGAVGLTGLNRMAHVKKYVKINGPGAFLRAHTMNIHSTATVPNQIYSPAIVELPDMLINNTSGFAQTITIPDNTTITVSDNYSNFTIGSHCNVTFTGNIFGIIVYDAGTTILFTQGLLDIQEIDAKMAMPDNKSYMKFSQDAVIRVPKTVRIQESCVVNPDNYHVVFYIGVAEISNPGELQVFPKGVTFNASAYVPYGQIHTEHDASVTLPGIMKGQYIAKKFNSNGKYVYWNWSPCTPVPYSTAASPDPVIQNLTEDVNLKVYPNPFTDIVNIDLQSTCAETVNIQIFNLLGVKVFEMLNQELPENTNRKFTLTNNQLPEPGLYLMRITMNGKEYFQRIVFL
ncbi:MAG: HYR domain-containing protein [Bacteroidetes bacterium]|nr:HYR domain-containing protein [Bacteroidota bacterium]